MNKDYFIEQIVFGWMKNDLENISKVKTIVPGAGNANFPLAMVTVMYMDHLGGYLLGRDKGFEANIREYLTCFKNPSGYPPELLKDLFRNGLGHDYFARGGISRNAMRPPMVYAPGIGVILDADSLLQDFITSLDTYKEKLTEDSFQKRFSEAKAAMEKIYVNHKAIIDALPEAPSPITIYPTITSNASGTAVYSDIANQEDKNTGGKV